MKIRAAKTTDHREILRIHELAFGKEEGPVIVKLVDDILADETAMPILSLVAVDNDKLLGHILFTRAVISQADRPISAHLLAPLAILPEEQKRGLGQRLINEGVKRLKEAGSEVVFVLGHPAYYPRCGFIPAGAQGFDAPYPIPDENADAWMMVELRAGVIQKNSGKVQCAKALDKPEYWRE